MRIGSFGNSRVFLFAAAVALSGCATMFSGLEQDLTVDTGNVKGAVCKGKDNNGKEHSWVNTPATAVVPKGVGTIKVTCEAEGFKKTEYSIEEQTPGAAWMNVLTLGLGAIVDAENCLKAAFNTDVTPALVAWRTKHKIPADPLAAHRDSGYASRAAAERSRRRKELGIVQGGSYA